MKSGIYKIEDSANNKVYIGSAQDLNKRIVRHKLALRKGIHYNYYLQQAWNKTNGKSFRFSILLICAKNELLLREQELIDKYKAADRKYGYNILISAGSPKTHGMRDSKEYKIWCKMKSRCYYLKNNRYAENGGRGIKVCDRWKSSFQNFLDDMGICPKGKQIGRKNINEGYDSTNCEWKTASEAMKNNRRAKLVVINNEIYNVKDAEKLLGIYRASINQRSRKFNETYQQATDHFAKKKGFIK